VGWFKTVISKLGWIFFVARRGGRFVLACKNDWMISLFVRIGAITSMGKGIVLQSS